MTPIFATSDVGRLRGRWVVWDYDGSFSARPSRPLVRLERAGRPAVEALMPAPVHGRARWRGLMPADLVRVQVLAVDPAAIRLHPVRVLPRLAVAWQLLLRDRTAFLAEVVPCAGAPKGRANRARSVLDRLPLDRAGEAATRWARRPETDGFDRPAAAAAAPRLRFVVEGGEDGPALRRTLLSLAAQADPLWTAVVIAAAPENVGAFVEGIGAPRQVVVAADAPVAGVGEAGGAWCAALRAGDRLPDWAVLAVRCTIARQPGLQLLYTDGLEAGQGCFGRGWSPASWRSGVEPGPLLFTPPDLVRAPFDDDAREAVRRAAPRLREPEVAHLPRLAILRDAPEPAGRALPAVPRSAPAAAFAAPAAFVGPVSIVIPTRDRIDLLRSAVESLFARTASGDFALIVADNGSAEPEAVAYLRAIDGRRRTRVLAVPGPFNFSGIVNAAVAASAGAAVVLLNNDVVITEPDWLRALTAPLGEPDVGAVGARLLYPDGRLQHAGIVVGGGGYAGHFGRLSPGDAPGPGGLWRVPHEVSAVTAACLAVTRRNWDLVGGFDEGLAVAFNDVDFCLRLRARGLRNLWTPAATLVHAESASRGEDRGPKRDRFRAERAVFAERWRDVVADDPYFPPGWSPYRNEPVLE